MKKAQTELQETFHNDEINFSQLRIATILFLCATARVCSFLFRGMMGPVATDHHDTTVPSCLLVFKLVLSRFTCSFTRQHNNKVQMKPRGVLLIYQP